MTAEPSANSVCMESEDTPMTAEPSANPVCIEFAPTTSYEILLILLFFRRLGIRRRILVKKIMRSSGSELCANGGFADGIAVVAKRGRWGGIGKLHYNKICGSS